MKKKKPSRHKKRILSEISQIKFGQKTLPIESLWMPHYRLVIFRVSSNWGLSGLLRKKTRHDALDRQIKRIKQRTVLTTDTPIHCKTQWHCNQDTVLSIKGGM